MILKIRGSESKGEGKIWQFIDNVESIAAGIDGENGEKLIEFTREGLFHSRDITDGCFLLNDQGKTIERLA